MPRCRKDWPTLTRRAVSCPNGPVRTPWLHGGEQFRFCGGGCLAEGAAWLRHRDIVGSREERYGECASQSFPLPDALGHEYYNKLGYVPYNVGINENAARTLEYAYDDWCIYQLGLSLGKSKKELAPFAKRALNYRNLFDSDYKADARQE